MANASLFGAKTVRGPSPLSVSTRPAASTAVTSVDRSGLAEATVATVSKSSLKGCLKSKVYDYLILKKLNHNLNIFKIKT